MAGLLVSYSDSVEGTFSQVGEGEHFYWQGYLMVRTPLDSGNSTQYLGDTERAGMNVADDDAVRILKDCTVRPDDGATPPPEPPVEPPPEEIVSGSVDSQ